MIKESLNAIKKIYQRGDNIIEYLKDDERSIKNTDEIIMISYDLQSGSYIKKAEENPEFIKKYTNAIAKVFNKLDLNCKSILEVGVGEATTLANLVSKLKKKPEKIYGFDLAWSRVRYGIEYTKKKKVADTFLFVGDLFNIPLADNSIDIVYTSHSIEPNGGREEEALKELMRVTNKYLILLEPAYEFADDEAKMRMEKHGYIKDLYSTAVTLGFNVIEHRLFDLSANPLNPTGLMIIEKNNCNNERVDNVLMCPITKTPLSLMKNSYFTEKGLIVYPVIDGVPCLLNDNAVIATHYSDDFKSV